MKLDEYLIWRDEMLMLDKPGRLLDTPRGECSVVSQIHITMNGYALVHVDVLRERMT